MSDETTDSLARLVERQMERIRELSEKLEASEKALAEERAETRRIISIVTARTATDAKAYERDQYLIKKLREQLAAASKPQEGK